MTARAASAASPTAGHGARACTIVVGVRRRTFLLAAGLGLAAGPILGVAQWTVLRRFVNRGGRWLWANALAWAVGMPVIFLGMDRVPWNGHPLAAILSIYAICTIVGVVVGAVHGRVLVQLLDTARRDAV